MTDQLNDNSKTTFETADPMADLKRSKFAAVPTDSNNSSMHHFGTPISGIVTPGATNGLATPSAINSPAGFNSNSNPNTPHFDASTLGTPNFTSFQEGDYNNSLAISPMESQPIDTSKVTTNTANSPTAMALMGSGLKNSKSFTNLAKQQTAKKQESPAKKAALSSQNPEELTDAVAAAGVNIRAEEEAMVAGLTVSKRQIEPNNFLKSQQLAWFMRKTMEEQGLKEMEFDADLINLMSSACETYMTNIVSDSIVISRHRRRSVKTKQKQNISNSKSEISKALKDIATKQKEREEKRMKRRIALGLEEEKKEEDMVAEHKQTNLTASMMMSGSKKKKYSWMQASSKNNAISARGDNGIRYREAREEGGVVLRDLMMAIENRRIGANNTIVKGYAKMRD